jgi:dTDP-4-dehydrorhamnose reductase
MRIAILGANGQLGSDIVAAARAAGIDVCAATRTEADVTEGDCVSAYVAALRPDWVVNTTAWTDLAGCEREPMRALAVNAGGALNAARAAHDAGARFAQVSTDYVFDGGKGAPYIEGDARRALNVYGASKLAGEDLAAQGCPGALIVRVAGLFGVAGASGKGGNFVETMLRLQREGKPIRVVADQVTSPTHTADVAGALLGLLEGDASGEHHLAAAGSCSWHEFAAAVFEIAEIDTKVEPMTAAEFGGPVRRPAFSALASKRLAALPHWRDGLERYLRLKGHVR